MLLLVCCAASKANKGGKGKVSSTLCRSRGEKREAPGLILIALDLLVDQ
jgi:hypothetical protein